MMNIEDLGILIEYIENNGKPEFEYIDGRTYSKQQLKQVKPDTIPQITVKSLNALITYIKQVNDVHEPKFIINIKSPQEVTVYRQLDQESCRREKVLVAEAFDYSPDLTRWTDIEDVIIQLKTRFVQTTDLDATIATIGNLKREEGVELDDDGVSQRVTTKKGIQYEKTLLPTYLKLKPFRTFVEIGQPESPFILRINDHFQAKLLEADGGTWKLAAFENIKNYLQENLVNENGEVLAIVL